MGVDKITEVEVIKVRLLLLAQQLNNLENQQSF